eukprot:363261-Chlamydomonas_euryale.AAC.3
MDEWMIDDEFMSVGTMLACWEKGWKQWEPASVGRTRRLRNGGSKGAHFRRHHTRHGLARPLHICRCGRVRVWTCSKAGTCGYMGKCERLPVRVGHIPPHPTRPTLTSCNAWVTPRRVATRRGSAGSATPQHSP